MSAAAVSSPQLAAALDYAARGWAVFPLYAASAGVCSCPKGAACTRPGKHPKTANGFKDATSDARAVTSFDWRGANVGIASGSGLAVIDIDPRHGGDESLAALEAKHGPLPSTIEVITGGGGRHLYFRTPREIPSS